VGGGLLVLVLVFGLVLFILRRGRRERPLSLPVAGENPLMTAFGEEDGDGYLPIDEPKAPAIGFEQDRMDEPVMLLAGRESAGVASRSSRSTDRIDGSLEDLFEPRAASRSSRSTDRIDGSLEDLFEPRAASTKDPTTWSGLESPSPPTPAPPPEPEPVPEPEPAPQPEPVPVQTRATPSQPTSQTQERRSRGKRGRSEPSEPSPAPVAASPLLGLVEREMTDLGQITDQLAEDVDDPT
jgi:hypothetical protein